MLWVFSLFGYCITILRIWSSEPLLSENWCNYECGGAVQLPRGLGPSSGVPAKVARSWMVGQRRFRKGSRLPTPAAAERPSLLAAGRVGE